MNKWIVALLLVLVLATVYLILPRQISVDERVSVKVNSASAYRFLADQDNWSRWWPGNKVKTGAKTPFAFEQYTYNLQQNFFQSLVIQIDGNDRSTGSSLSLVSLGIDNTIFEWKAAVGGSPFQKMNTYLRAKNIQGDMKEILKSLQSFLEKEENLYGFKVKYGKVKDTMLVTTKFASTVYPPTNEIYKYISVLNAYIASQGATGTNYPMLNVQHLDSSHFETMLAIPVNRELKGSGNIAFKRMVAGNILEAEVSGGSTTSRQALVQLKNYVDDHQLASPAIPFMSLVTNRSQEKDTARWVTRLYYPVF